MKKIVWLFNLRHSKCNDHSPAIIWWYGILEKFGYEVLYEPYEDYNFEEFYSSLKEYKPDFVIHTCYDKIHTEMIRLREFTKLYVLQSDDIWRYPSYSKYWIPLIDGVISYDGDVKNYESDGLDPKNFCDMRWAFNPNIMGQASTKDTRDILLSHFGGLHGDRSKIISDFNSKGMSVNTYQNIPYSDIKSFLSRSKYSLCLTMNSTMTMREPKGRAVEIPNFCAMLSEPWHNIDKYYDKDEIILFDSVDEGVDKIKYYESHPDEYEKIFQKGRNALLSRNTAYHEWNRILPQIDKDFQPVDVKKLMETYHKDLL